MGLTGKPPPLTHDLPPDSGCVGEILFTLQRLGFNVCACKQMTKYVSFTRTIFLHLTLAGSQGHKQSPLERQRMLLKLTDDSAQEWEPRQNRSAEVGVRAYRQDRGHLMGTS